MELRTITRTITLCNRADNAANYDGVAVEPYQFVECPYCHEPAIIVHTHNGGYPEHHGWRCMTNRQHQGPLLPWSPIPTAGRYRHDGWLYEIVPLVLEEDAHVAA